MHQTDLQPPWKEGGKQRTSDSDAVLDMVVTEKAMFEQSYTFDFLIWHFKM